LEPTRSTISARDGVALAVEDFKLEAARARVLVVHGFAEHSGRYGEVVAALTSAGFECHLFDLRGHGRSGGVSAHVDRFEEYVDDLDRARSHVRELPGGPRKSFLLAHSLGGLIAMIYALRGPAALDGLVVTSPYLHRAFAVPTGAAFLAAVASRIAPKLRIAIPLRPEWLSHDRHVTAGYLADDQIRRATTPRWATEVDEAQRTLRRRAGEIKLPLLMMLGGSDPIADPGVSQQVFAALGSEDKQLALYPGFLHEVLNETERHRVVSDLTAWLSVRA
jgi:alpha-beta hydrolase superfamily lysophospholipase